MTTAISTTTTATIHHSSSVPSVMSLSLAPPTITSSSSLIHVDASSECTAPPTHTLSLNAPRRTFTHPPPAGCLSTGSTMLPFVPLTPIIASPSLTPEPAPESRERKDMGAPGCRSGGTRQDDYLGAKVVEAGVDTAKDKVELAPVSQSTPGQHEVDTIPYVPSPEVSGNLWLEMSRTLIDSLHSNVTAKIEQMRLQIYMTNLVPTYYQIPRTRTL